MPQLETTYQFVSTIPGSDGYYEEYFATFAEPTALFASRRVYDRVWHNQAPPGTTEAFTQVTLDPMTAISATTASWEAYIGRPVQQADLSSAALYLEDLVRHRFNTPADWVVTYFDRQTPDGPQMFSVWVDASNGRILSADFL